VNGGIQYDARLSKKSLLRFGVTADLGQTLSASQDVVREIFNYTGTGTPVRTDSVSQKSNIAGTINLPASYKAGVSYNTNTFVLGAEYQTTNWDDYRFYGQKDNVANSYMVRVGAQIIPDPISARKYWSRVSYRAGVYFGKDPVVINNRDLPVKAITVGFGLPVRKFRNYDNQFTVVNTAFELGKRGNKDNNITESFFRFSLGLNLSDIWFQKRRYD
jgi:hypothetical protein